MDHETSAVWDAGAQVPAFARALVSTFLVQSELQELIPAATLIVSELVTNSVVHAGGRITVHAYWSDPTLRVEVRDQSQTPARVRVHSDESGRGLHIVDTLATHWASEPTHNDGKVTWFELQHDPDAARTRPPPPTTSSQR